LDGAWTEESSEPRWYLYDLARSQMIEDPTAIVTFIRCSLDTARKCDMSRSTLAEIRAKVEKHIKDGYLRSINAPVSARAVLKAWMELN